MMVRSAYVAAMRGVALPLRATGVLDRWQRAPHDSFAFWLGSQFAIHDAAALARMDVPWWTFPAIDAVDRWIAARNGDVRVFEYGSGASTVWLARRAARVVSVEHDVGFAKIAAPMLALPNVELRVIEPARAATAPRAPSGRRGYGDCDFSAYVDSIADGAARYDLVVIDGRARVACLDRAWDCLDAGGLVVFDNSNRRRYQAALGRAASVLRRYRGWAPALPYPSETTLIEKGRAAG
jgi:predicted O-methyltransferase YrrM